MWKSLAFHISEPSRDMEYYPFLFQGYGILCSIFCLLSWILDRKINYGDICQFIRDTCLFTSIGTPYTSLFDNSIAFKSAAGLLVLNTIIYHMAYGFNPIVTSTESKIGPSLNNKKIYGRDVYHGKHYVLLNITPGGGHIVWYPTSFVRPMQKRRKFHGFAEIVVVVGAQAVKRPTAAADKNLDILQKMGTITMKKV